MGPADDLSKDKVKSCNHFPLVLKKKGGQEVLLGRTTSKARSSTETIFWGVKRTDSRGGEERFRIRL